MTTMTAFIPGPRQPGVPEVSTRLSHLLNDRQALAQWWVELVNELDELSIRLLAENQTVWQGLQAQLQRDAPHMSPQLRRLDAEQEHLQDEVLRLRIEVGRSAGDPGQARRIRDSVRDLLHRLRRHEERTTQVLYDAYQRDIGGESA
jgi:hypothetical protein